MAEPTKRVELEDRIRKLEAALAERPAADEVTDRVIAKLSAMAAEHEAHPESARVMVLASGTAPPPPHGAVLHPPAPPTDPAKRTWFLTQLASELRLAARMYFDPHYRISRTTQFALPGIVLLLVFNYYLFSVWMNITFLSPVLERLLIVFLVIIGYKLFTRELIRYREVLEYLARYGGK